MVSSMHEPKDRKPRPVPSTEEAEQMKRWTAGNPWELSYKEFLRRVVAEYNFELCRDCSVIDPQGRTVEIPFLKSRDDGRVVLLPGKMRDEDLLDQHVTASLCRRIRIPPEDFGLPQEEHDAFEGDEDDFLGNRH